jgi:hypothetical protein
MVKIFAELKGIPPSDGENLSMNQRDAGAAMLELQRHAAHAVGPIVTGEGARHRWTARSAITGVALALLATGACASKTGAEGSP